MNNTRNDTKENTSTYLVQKFLATEFSHEYLLLPADVSILFMIARYLDMPKKACYAKQIVLANDARVSERTFRDRTLYLQKIGLINRYTKWKLYHYELGGIITGNEIDLM